RCRPGPAGPRRRAGGTRRRPRRPPRPPRRTASSAAKTEALRAMTGRPIRRLPGPPLTPAQRALASSPAALAMAARVARPFGRRYATLVSQDDLDGVARLGLAQAARSYDESLGVAFEVFAWSRVHGAMMDAARGEAIHERRARAALYRVA